MVQGKKNGTQNHFKILMSFRKPRPHRPTSSLFSLKLASNKNIRNKKTESKTNKVGINVNYVFTDSYDFSHS